LGLGAGAKQQKGQRGQEAEPTGWNMPISERRHLTQLRYLISYAELHHHDGGRIRATDSVLHVSPILSRSRADYLSCTTIAKSIPHECVQRKLKNIPGSATSPAAPDAVEGFNLINWKNGVAPHPSFEDRGTAKNATIRPAAITLAPSSLAALEVFHLLPKPFGFPITPRLRPA
jgi:hypothetical protein